MIQYKAVTGGGRIIDGVASVGRYPDGMPLVTERPAAEVFRIMVRGDFNEFVAAMFLVSAWGAHGHLAELCELLLPFVPGARQDRLNTAGDVLFTARSVANMINARDFCNVVIFDPHSDVTPALIDRCTVVTAADCINPPAGKYAAVISPDAGAEKRASAVAKKLGVPLLHAWKSRDTSTGAITGFGMEEDYLRPNQLVLVVDDICDGGGTFVGLAGEIAKRDKLTPHLFVTHGLFTQGTQGLLAHYRHVYTTDSTLGDYPDVIKINACQNYFDKGSL